MKWRDGESKFQQINFNKFQQINRKSRGRKKVSDKSDSYNTSSSSSIPRLVDSLGKVPGILIQKFFLY
jgi:hypothetical protein